jgi:hypothetical protein
MSNVKVIFIILINTFFISICNIQFSYHNFLVALMPLLGVANYKYLKSNARITNKQKNLIELFFLTSVILFLLIRRNQLI